MYNAKQNMEEEYCRKLTIHYSVLICFICNITFCILSYKMTGYHIQGQVPEANH